MFKSRMKVEKSFADRLKGKKKKSKPEKSEKEQFQQQQKPKDSSSTNESIDDYENEMQSFGQPIKDNMKENLLPDKYTMFKRDIFILIIVATVVYSLFGVAYYQYVNDNPVYLYLYSGMFNILLCVLFFVNFKANWGYLLRKLKFNMGKVILAQRNRRLATRFVDLNKYPVVIDKTPYFPHPKTVSFDGNMPTYLFIQGLSGSLNLEDTNQIVTKNSVVQPNAYVDSGLIDRVLSAQEEVVEKKNAISLVNEMWKRMKWYIIGILIASVVAAVLTYTMYDQWITMFPEGTLSAERFISRMSNLTIN